MKLAQLFFVLAMAMTLRADQFDTLRLYWQSNLVNNGSSPSSVATTANNYWSSMSTSPTRTYLWGDLPFGSVSANIVEGREQQTDREFARFLGYALASASELEHHFIVARDLRAITGTDFASALGQIIDVRKMVHGLLAKLAKSKKSPSKRTVPSTSADSVKRTAGSG